MAENPLNPSIANAGLNTQSTSGQVSPGQLTYALNAILEAINGEAVTYQNEGGNTPCVTFPEGYVAIGMESIPSRDMIVYLLTNPETGDSEIGVSYNSLCKYEQVVSDKGMDHKLNFSIHYPVHKIHSKVTNCGFQVYWTDGLNPRYYLDFENLPWQEVPDPLNDFKPIKLVGQLDVNKMRVQPDFAVPNIVPIRVTDGGQLKSGVVQFAVAYSDAVGNIYTSWYGVTNEVSIFQDVTGAQPDVTTSKAVDIRLENLDTSGLWDYITIAAIKTVNGTTSAYIADTLPITHKEINYTYTGVDKSEEQLDMIEIIRQFDYYDTAQGSFEVDGVLGWFNLTKDEEINYQQVANQINVGWETYKVPYSQWEGYRNGINSAIYRTYPRDEVIALEIYFILKGGKRTRSFHIPGRVATSYDRDMIESTNPDSMAIRDDECQVPGQLQRWQVYNTGSVKGFTEEYLKNKDKANCYVGPYEWGENAYWESSKKYPNNPHVWGPLAGQPIRHHKLPDNRITHIHDNSVGDDRTYEHSIYPIGFRIDEYSLLQAIKSSNLTQVEKDQIIGYGIARGNRAGGNKSVEAKGLFTNVGEYIFEDNSYLYANYPFNDLRKDPYFATERLDDHVGYRPDKALDGFSAGGARSRFTFYSPNTLFPGSSPEINGGGGFSIKLDTIEYGSSYGHFVKVDKNAEYKFLTRNTTIAAAGIGLSSGMIIGAGTYGWPHYSMNNVLPTFKDSLDLFEKLAPNTNFGYQHNAIGYYSKYYPIPNTGHKARNIEYAKYLREGQQAVEDGQPLNHFSREGCLYIKARESVLFPHEYDPEVPVDTSRYTLSSYYDTDNDLDEFLTLFLANPSAYATEEAIGNSLLNFSTEGSFYKFYIETNSYYNNPIAGDILIEDGVNTFKVVDSDMQPDIVGNNINEYKGWVWAEATSAISNLPSGPSLITLQGMSIPMTYTGWDVITSFEYYVPDRIHQYHVDLTAILLTIGSLSDLSDFEAADGSTNEGYLKHQAAQLFINLYHQWMSDKVKREPGLIKRSDISAYYGAIKRYIPDQYGSMYSYETIDTGFRKLLDSNNIPKDGFVVFGGDTFINRFALKKKLSHFLDTTVGDDHGTDIQYDEIATYGYPMFWVSTKPRKFDIDITKEAQAVQDKVQNVTFLDAIAGIFSGGGASVKPAIKLIVKVFQEIYEKLGIKNVNLDMYSVKGLVEQGIMYLYSYGIPYFFVESTINVDYRQATNELEGNFYPNTGEGVIPDRWLQEVEVPIKHDNSYTYNSTYSKQNKETFFSHLREDFDPTKVCIYSHPNRAIWAEQSDVEETKNHWLSYLPGSKHDFTKGRGQLISLDGIENRQVLARYEDGTQLHNVLTTIEVSQGPDAFLGNSRLFSTPPIDLSTTDVGNGGSQNRLLLRTEHGHVFINARLGEVLLVRGNSPALDLANQDMKAWFANHLPFEIAKSFPDINTDNAMHGVGVSGVYDSLYDRIIITKKDYKPLVDGITLIDNEFYFNDKKIVLTDPTYFCDRSWTISYMFPIPGYFKGGWISWHSYQPSFYVPLSNYFLSSDARSTWVHNKTFSLYNTYYGQVYPYILEYPISYSLNDEILQNISDYCTTIRYESEDIYYEPEEILYFNKAILYNRQQCTGLLNLIPRPKNSLRAAATYPKYNTDSKDIILSKSDNLYNFNTFWDIQRSPGTPAFTATCSMDMTDKDLNDVNLDYSRRNQKGAMRAKDLRVRLILDDKQDVKLISRFMLSPTKPSIK